MGSEMPSGLPGPGGASHALWQECQHEVLQALHHPFVVAMAAGTLARSSFKHYVAQDTFFLHHFAAAYKAAVDKCRAGGHVPPHPRIPVAEVEAVLQKLLDGVDEELQLHGSYAASWGVDSKQLVPPSPATKAYTDFLMQVAHDPQASVAEVMASMAPCARLYAFLGCTLAAAHGTGAPQHPYTHWLDTYSSEAYLAAPDAKERVLDALAQPEDYDKLLALYRRAMQLEVDFFSAQPDMPQQRKVQLLVADFDDTCTEKDTIGLLLAAAADAAGRRAAATGSEAQAAAVRQAVQQRAKELATNYMDKQQQLLAKLVPAQQEEAPGSAAAGGPFQPAALQAFLEELSAFDATMNQLVVTEGILAGLSEADIASAASQVQLRPGCMTALAAAAAAGAEVQVVSVNWSSRLVAAALKGAAGGGRSPKIHANELVMGEDGLTTGAISSAVQHALDKGAAFDRLLLQQQGVPSGTAGAGTASGAAADATAGACNGTQQLNGHHHASSSSSSGGTGGCSVYVGDSISDLPPLLKADYGIIIGSNQVLRRVCQHFGIRVAPLCTAPTTPGPLPLSAQTNGSAGVVHDGPILYTADSWQHIAAFVTGPPPLQGAAGPAAAVNGQSSSGSKQQQGALGAIRSTATPTSGGSGGQRHFSMARVLSVAGSDSGGGAGIQADLKAVLAQGAFGMTAVTAITAQNSHGVQGVHVVPPATLELQLDSVLGDFGADVVKTGMLADAATVELVARKVKQYSVPQLVVDPVMVSTSGHSLAAGEVVAALKQHLIPLATLITPNLIEAAALLGDTVVIHSLEDMKVAAQKLHALGARYVLVKGGHLLEQHQQQQQAAAVGSAALQQQQQQGDKLLAVDVLYDGSTFWELSSSSVTTSNLHGTGCTLAASIAAQLALGKPVVAAVAAAKGYLTSVLEGSKRLALGRGRQHPFHHGADLIRVTTPMSAASVFSTTSNSSSSSSSRGFSTSSSVGGQVQASWGQGRALVPCDVRLYVVTDSNCNKKAGRSLEEAVAAAVAGGATIVQLREKDVEGGAFLEAAAAVVRVCRPLGVPVIINDRVDIALAVDADGVHVGQSDMPAAVVRRLLGPNKILGVSVKTPQQAVQAVQDGADYLGCGAVYPTGTKDSDVIGLQGLAAVCEAVWPVPVVSIGGVGLANAGDTVKAGAAGIAVVSAVFAAPDAVAAAAGLRAAVDAAVVR